MKKEEILSYDEAIEALKIYVKLTEQVLPSIEENHQKTVTYLTNK